MAHYKGEVLQNGQARALFEYNGTIDQIIPRLYLTDAELEANWRMDAEARCTCGLPSETIQILPISWDKGRVWNGTACFRCMVITSPLSADDYYPD